MKNGICVIGILVLILSIGSFAAAGEIIELDFSSADQSENFATIEDGTGNWEIKDGALYFTQERGDPQLNESWWNIIALTASSYKDFILEFDLYLDDNEYLMVTFGSEEPLLRHEYQNSYGVNFWNYHTTGGKKAAEFIKTTPDEPGYPVLGISRQTVSAFEVNNIKMVKNGTSFKLYLKTVDPDLSNEGIDGETELLNLENPIEDKEGYIQLFSGNGGCRIENFRIRPFVEDEVSLSEESSSQETNSMEETVSIEETPSPAESQPDLQDDKEQDNSVLIYIIAGIAIALIGIVLVIKFKKK